MGSIYLTCIQCDDDFEFSANEQKLYDDRGFDEPRRCPACRRHKAKLVSHSGKKKNDNNKKKHYRRKYEDYSGRMNHV